MELYGLYGVDFYYISFRSYKKVKFGLVSLEGFSMFFLKLRLNSCLKNCNYSLPNKVSCLCVIIKITSTFNATF